MTFFDRTEAGRALATAVRAVVRADEDLVVLALPRGGVPVAAEIARALRAPLDTMIVRKIGLPGRPEYAMGALAEGRPPILDEVTIRRAGVRAECLTEAIRRAETELARAVRTFRAGRVAPELTGRVVLIVDDGVATGATVRVAVDCARARGARRVGIAVPVAPRSVLRQLAALADDVLCVDASDDFVAVSQAYAHFEQLSDRQVVAVLESIPTRSPGRTQAG
ncbi:MAG: phosphoribosyltransferase [Actinobacteria bacterium]|nr:phosphoribosyltransferase [Actinomycetota bacterium]